MIVRLHKNHWRYRVLHWAFSGRKHDLPDYFYKHYCPLFHMTNLIVLFCIPIAFVKLLIYLFRCGESVLAKLEDKYWPSHHIESLQSSGKDWSLRRIESILWAHVREDAHNKQGLDWILNEYKDDMFWEYVSKEEFTQLYVQYVKRQKLIALQNQEAKERIAERKNQILKYIEFSQFIFKPIVFLTKIATAIFVGWLGYKVLSYVPLICIAMWHFCNWVMSHISQILAYSLGVFGTIGLATAILYVMVKMERTRNLILSPITISWAILCGLFSGIMSGLNTLKEFCGAFYVENCPPIELIGDDDENTCS